MSVGNLSAFLNLFLKGFLFLAKFLRLEVFGKFEVLCRLRRCNERLRKNGSSAF